MRDDELDRILSGDEAIVPSAGFVAGVMESVRQQSMSAPIPFPWGRALPGLAAVAIMIGAFATTLNDVAHDSMATAAQGWSSALVAVLYEAQRLGLGWMSAALLLSAASVALSTHYVRRRL